ncbi:homoserine dehydrogenase [Nigerium massiliense]|uniref:homoserine dehydrogenase n=1 Tax=Nigerium massiliense TaxID=1522317 RepID=UPI00058FCC76
MIKRNGPLRLALLGCGVVGSQVARLLLEEADEFEARVGRRLELVGIGVRHDAERPGIDPALLTTDVEGLLAEPDIDLVVELIGGIDPARAYVLSALRSGASVVTANKALLASHPELFAAAAEAGVDLYYEAAVAGAIPIIRPLSESLIGDAVTSVTGVVNGTTNYILDQMHTAKVCFPEALADAQRLGYAEADPTADVEGDDAAAKAALLASLAFHTRVTRDDVETEGISAVTEADIEAAEELRCVIKLLAHCSLDSAGSVTVNVHPTMVPLEHPLASIHGANNAIFVECINAGQLMFMGPGAGGTPTASAVLGDIVTAARNRVRGVAGPAVPNHQTRGITEPSEASSRYYLQLLVEDSPGVLARLAEAFAERGVSIQVVRQEPCAGEEGPEVTGLARLGVMTHAASHRDVAATVSELESLPQVREGVRVMRVEGM